MENQLSDKALVHNAKRNVSEAIQLIYSCWPPRPGREQTSRLERAKLLLSELVEEPNDKEARVAWHLARIAQGRLGLMIEGYTSYPKTLPQIGKALFVCRIHLVDFLQQQR